MTNSIYQVLNISGHGLDELMALTELNKSEPDKWLIQSRSEDGLNVHYQLCIVYPKGEEFQVTLPWQAQRECPNCQGQGVVYRWSRDNSSYEAAACEECRGQGSAVHDSEISVTINDGLGGQRVIRKCRAGNFNARLGLRGDLILNITWVEELPRPEAEEQSEALAN